MAVKFMFITTLVAEVSIILFHQNYASLVRRGGYPNVSNCSSGGHIVVYRFG